jgi:hypothetical protein
MKKNRFAATQRRLLLSLFSALAIVLLSHAPLSATLIGGSSWSGAYIMGEDSSFLPSGSALFDLTGNTLEITLTNTTTQVISANWQVLTGLSWDGSLSLTPVSAVISSGSLEGPGATVDTNLSSEWGFKNLNAGSSPSGPIGSYGISAVGDVNNGADSFEPKDRFDTSGNLFGPPSGSLNGVDAGIIGLPASFNPNGGFQGPVVSNQMKFTFTVSNPNSLNISNIQPFFGSDGAFLVPEPATMLLLGTGLIGMAAIGRRKFFKK